MKSTVYGAQLGAIVIVFEDEYYRFNREMDYEYDVEAFDSHIQRAHKTADTSARIEHLQKAVDLVHGPYLADVNADWVVPERERLGAGLCFRSRRIGIPLSEHQPTGALSYRYASLALNQDRFHEIIYQFEMRAYAALGDRSRCCATVIRLVKPR